MGVVEALDHEFIIPLVRGYWMSMTRYRHKASNVEFLFFNSHWKHGYGSDQKQIIANAIHAERQKYESPPPTIFVGDTNQFCMSAELEAIKYLKGEEGDSPVTFTDAIGHDKGRSYDGGCRIDFILASKGQWLRVDSFIDRDGMGVHGSASDHAALMAELVPVAGDVSPDVSAPTQSPSTPAASTPTTENLVPSTTAAPIEEGSVATDNCCDKCPGEAFCSPNSGKCYGVKSKDYYESCVVGETDDPPSEGSSCCSKCEQGLPGFCSPHSGNCYDSQKKDYYQSCPDGGLAPPSRLPPANTSEGALKFMSYNLFGWNAFNQHKWKRDNIIDKIKDFGPSVLGAQEVETGGGNGGSYVSEKITSSTGLSGGAGLNQFYDSRVVEALDHEFIIPLVRGYWMSMTRFRHKATNVEFLFFNSHWKHGYGSEQKEIIANAIHAERQKYSSPPPTIFVGDTNQFCMAAELEAIKYLKGEEGDSPVTFTDAMGHDKGSSYDGGCRIDFILASKGQWLRVDSFIDRDGMGVHGSASDHAALMAELVPISADESMGA